MTYMIIYPKSGLDPLMVRVLPTATPEMLDRKIQNREYEEEEF